jgi:AbrB family looped-hinge helix DNA binding protein
MKQSKVSVRGQTVIPQEIRERLGIKPNTRLAWFVRDGAATVIPVPDDPIRASLGMLKGSGFTFEDFIRERNRERELEREREERAAKGHEGGARAKPNG